MTGWQVVHNPRGQDLRQADRHARPVALVGFDDVELAEVFATPLTVAA